MSISTTGFEFLPPEELIEEEYQDPFIVNEDGTIDMDLSGQATIRGERLRVKQKLRVEGNTELDLDLDVGGNLKINGSLIINGVDVTSMLLGIQS
jgi:hypothetical protein